MCSVHHRFWFFSLKTPMPNYFSKALSKRYYSFLLREWPLPPAFYLILLVYFHLDPPGSSSCIFYCCLGLGMLTLDINAVFAMGSLAHTPLPMILLLAIVSLVTCLEEWKLMLLTVSVVSNLTEHPLLSDVYLGCAALYVCVRVYQQMVFDTVSHNRQYFCGMSGLIALTIIRAVQALQCFEFNILETALMVTVITASALPLFEHRLQQIKGVCIDSDQNSRFVAFRLMILEQSMKQPQNAAKQLNRHRSQCSKTHCFCKSDKTYQPCYLLEQLYMNATSRFGRDCDPLLSMCYVRFLISQDKVIKALYYLSLQRELPSLFRRINRDRCFSRIKDYLLKQNSQNIYVYQYESALAYDKLLVRLNTLISQTLDDKAVFIKETLKPEPKARVMQSLGHKIVEQMSQLNHFYTYQIKTAERKINCFEGSILYASYLRATTNHESYATFILRSCTKQLETAMAMENSYLQTSCIRASVADPKKYECKASPGFHSDQLNSGVKAETTDTSFKFKLIIDQISQSFCELMGVNKKEVVGSQLNTIIPQGYKEVHNIRLGSLIGFQNQQVTQVAPSYMLHKELLLPMKGQSSQLHMAYICIKFQIDIEAGLTFMSIVKKCNSRSSNALMNFNGQITESECHFDQRITRHRIFKEYLRLARLDWEQSRKVSEQVFDLMINGINYKITIDSPLISMFLNKDRLHRNPPLHIKIENDNIFCARNLKCDFTKKGSSLKQMSQACTSASTKDDSGIKDSTDRIEDYISEGRVKFYDRALLVFVLTALLSFGSVYSNHLKPSLAWDPTQTSNSFNQTLRFVDAEYVIVKSLMLVSSLRQFENNPEIDQDRALGLARMDNKSVFLNQFNKYRERLQRELLYFSFEESVSVQYEIHQRLKSLISISSPQIVAPSPIIMPVQELQLSELILNYVADMSLFANGQVNKTILLDYSERVNQLVNEKGINQVMKSQANSMNLVNTVSTTCLIAVILGAGLYVYSLLYKRIANHRRLFELVASAEVAELTRTVNNTVKFKKSALIDPNQREYMKQEFLGRQRHQRTQSNIEISREHNVQQRTQDDEQTDGNNMQQNKPVSLRTTARRKGVITNVPQSYSQVIAARERNSTSHELAKKRTRSGEVQYRYSEFDVEWCFDAKACLVFLLLIVFTALMAVQLKQKTQILTLLDQEKDYVIGLKKQFIINYRVFYLFTRLVRGGRQRFQAMGVMTIQQFAQQVSSSPLQIEEVRIKDRQIKKDCVKRWASTQLYEGECYYLSEYRTWSQILPSAMKNYFNQIIPYLVDDSQLQTLRYFQTAISHRIYSFERHFDKLLVNVEGLMSFRKQKMKDMVVQFRKTKNLILVAGGVWLVVSMFVGIQMIRRMKRRYLEEVYMLSLLSEETLNKSKRISSFVSQLVG